MVFKTFYDFFKGYSPENVKKAINFLSEYRQCIIYMKYGKDLKHLNKVNISYDSFYNIVKKVHYILETKDLNQKIDRKIIPIYKIFNKYSKLEINNSINLLTKEEKRIITSKYGSNLENPVSSPDWNIQDAITFYFVIIPKLDKILLKNKSNFITKTIYEIFNDYTMEEIDDVLMCLTQDEKTLLEMKYNNDITWTFLFEKEFREFLIPKIRQKLKANRENKKRNIISIYNLLKDYTKEEIDNVIKDLNDNYKYILFLRFGPDLENPTSIYWDNSYLKDYIDLLKIIKKELKIRKNNLTNSISLKIKNEYFRK